MSDFNWYVYHGDCLEVLKRAPDAYFDSMVTDPPAGIDFMGRDWDCFRRKHNPKDVGRDSVMGRMSAHAPHSYGESNRGNFIATMTAIFQETLRVLKPGAHALVWALPRTSHWTATALEDAGFEIRDICHHHFGQGFPKSQDVGKFIDKLSGAEREVVETVTRRDIRNNAAKGRERSSGVHAALRDAPEYMEYEITSPATDEAKRWSGWGTALKPATEHWILARKPLSESSIARNVLKHGTGALNIDVCRVHRESDDVPGWHKTGADGSAGYQGEETFKIRSMSPEEVQERCGDKGRWPANLVISHSPSCEEGRCAPPWTEWSVVVRLGPFTLDLAEANLLRLVAFSELLGHCLRGSSRSEGRSHGLIGERERVQQALRSPSFQAGCPACSHFGDELLREVQAHDRESSRRLADVLERALDLLRSRLRSQPSRSGDPLTSEDGFLASSAASRTDESRTESSAPIFPYSTDGKGVDTSDRVGVTPLLAEPRCSSALNNRPGSCRSETPPCTVCTAAILRTLCLASADLALCYDLPLTIQLNSWEVNPCPVTELDRQSGQRPGCKTPSQAKCGSIYRPSQGSYQPQGPIYPDSGGASRYFPTFHYFAKPSRSEREKGLGALPERTLNRVNPGGLENESRFAPIQVKNNHPTVKGTKLMSWLISLITPPGGLVLDPFCGSGSTGVACMQEGFRFVGIEQDESYVEIAQHRIAAAEEETKS